MKIELHYKPSTVAVMAQSHDMFRVTGRGVYNPEFDHRIVGYVGVCCEEVRVHLHMKAQAAVIKDGYSTPPVTRHHVAIGDLVTIDHQQYRIAARMAGDPLLIPVYSPRR